MSRVLSTSLDKIAFFVETSNTSNTPSIRLHHAASAIELRRGRQTGYGRPSSSDGNRFQQTLRAVSSAASLPLGDISHNACRSVSRSSSSCGKLPSSSSHASECNVCWVQTPEIPGSVGSEAWLTPPHSERGISARLSPESHSPDSGSDAFPFPLNPALLPISSSAIGTNEGPRTPKRRLARSKYLTASPSPDRYISSRFSSQEPSKTFRLSKSPHQLTGSEKLLRHNSASPDPFGPLIVPRLRDTATITPINRDSAPRSRLTGTANVLSLPQDTVALQIRQASAGAIWNIGGNAQLTHTGPVRSVSNGRGGFLSSGSNAPMYTTQFFDDDISRRDGERLEARLAAALKIDQTSRILDVRTSVPRSVSTGIIGVKRKHLYIEPRTRWKDGEWTLEGIRSLLDAPGLRDDYYCTVLAYCHTAQTLAVGLSNRVYLWSESFGVRYPPEPASRNSTYVTSLSFSSTEGGHSILAIGRNSGQISLWSLYDPDSIRFQAQQPCAIACVAFKPVTTRRPSERFGCLMATEELLVGDEVGNIYYYSIEWMSKQQVDIHGWTGAMTLRAKIIVHSQQVCGLAWSSNGEFFATGANDNACCLFEVRDLLRPLETPQDISVPYRSPYQSLLGGFGLPNFLARSRTPSEIMGVLADGTQVHRTRIIPGQNGTLILGDGRQRHKWMHSAAIKAIAFCPWQVGLIAMGGGSNDRAIHFYHTSSGASLATINVHAQVTSLIWSTTRREIAATFGYAQPDHPYRIAVFSWPDCKQVVAIPWASDMRALYAIPYPGGPGETAATTSMGETWYSRTRDEGCIVVASSDESVKFHEVWSGASRCTAAQGGLLGGSGILEELEGIEREDRVIR